MNSDTIIAISLSVSNWDVVLAALAELPFKISAPIIQKIQDQAQAAVQAEAPLETQT